MNQPENNTNDKSEPNLNVFGQPVHIYPTREIHEVSGPIIDGSEYKFIVTVESEFEFAGLIFFVRDQDRFNEVSIEIDGGYGYADHTGWMEIDGPFTVTTVELDHELDTTDEEFEITITAEELASALEYREMYPVDIDDEDVEPRKNALNAVMTTAEIAETYGIADATVRQTIARLDWQEQGYARQSGKVWLVLRSKAESFWNRSATKGVTTWMFTVLAVLAIVSQL